jgi:protein phosphatase
MSKSAMTHTQMTSEVGWINLGEAEEPDVAVEVTAAALTHVGNVRKVNQDAFLESTQHSLWAVADGMGGHAAGEHASRLIIDRLSRLPSPRSSEEAILQIDQALNAANAQLLEDAKARETQIIGSTVVILSLVGRTAVIAWVGDSRLYRFRAGRLQQLTVDHTEVQEWVDQGRLSSEEAEHHPHSNVLARAIGAENQLRVDHRLETIEPGDRYLLCSDGLTKELGEQRLVGILSDEAMVSDCAARLVAEALSAGGRDNVTVVIAETRAG